MGSMADATGGRIDTCIEIVTPENIAFQYRVAGPFRRLPAFLLDVIFRALIGAVCTIAAMVAFGSIGAAGVGFGGAAVLWFVLSWFYFGLFEALWNGQTPGKRLMGLRVVSTEGLPITPFQAILRNILRVVDAQPGGLYLVGLVAAALNDRFQRLGDLPSGTMVVVEEQRFLRGVVRINEPEAIRAAAAIPPTFQPSRSLGRVLAAYVQRRQLFPWGRRIEIARHIGEPLRQKFQLPPALISTCCFAGCIAVRSSPIALPSRRGAIRRLGQRQPRPRRLPGRALWEETAQPRTRRSRKTGKMGTEW